MRNPLLWKVLSLVLLCILLLIPLSMIRGLVAERQERAAEVRKDMADYAGYPQNLTGPLLVLPYRKTTWRPVERRDGEATVTEWQPSFARSMAIVQPDQFDSSAALQTESLKRGIYSAEVYTADAEIHGRFTVPARTQLELPPSAGERIEYTWERPFIVLGVTDARGLRALAGEASGMELAFLPGTRVPWLAQGLHAFLPMATDDAGTVPYALRVKLGGTSELAIAPVGKANSVRLAGNWPHPAFGGRFGPIRRNVTERGFKAEWQTSHWATGIEEGSLRECVAAGVKCALFETDQLGVRLVNPVDQYLLTERTVKYSNLFLLVTFAAFLMMEVTRRLQVHPVQYGLVGLALAMFFLLTLSLSEHMEFDLAYWLAAAASIALLGYYVTFVLGGWRRGVGFSGLLTALYGLLFGILQSEDSALLIGSIALFALLAAVMVMTRKVDWRTAFAVSRASEPSPSQ